MNWQQIGFGGAALSGEGGGYGFGAVSEKDSQAILDYVFERGLYFYDLAPIYGYGLAEERIGRAFRLPHRREKVFLIDKGGVDWHPNRRVNMSNDPAVLARMLDESLRRLQTDYIDLYMIHWPDPSVDIRLALDVLMKAQENGKIRALGLSNPDRLDYEKVCDHYPVTGLQFEHHFFQRDFFANWHDVLQRHQQQQFFAWGTFDKGILSGRVTSERKYESTDARAWAPWWKKEKKNREEKLAKVQILQEVLNPYGVSMMQFALTFNQRWPATLGAYHLTSLCGGKSIHQWENIFTALEQPMSDEIWTLILKELASKQICALI